MDDIETIDQPHGAGPRPHTRRTQALALLLAMRPAHWSKNLVVFAPMFLARQAAVPASWWLALMALVALSFVSSSLYMVNDLIDRKHDRKDRWRRTRPIAAGQISPERARAAALIFLLCGLSVALAAISTGTAVIVMLYAALALAYSLALKQRRWLDCMALALLFVIRLAVGAAAISVPLSPWLGAWSCSLFLSLALAKRCTMVTSLAPGEATIAGRPWRRCDSRPILRVGIAVAALATLTLLGYAFVHQDTPELYKHPHFLWGMAPLVGIWLRHVWHLAYTGRLQQDLVRHAITDGRGLLLWAAVIMFWLLAAGPESLSRS